MKKSMLPACILAVAAAVSLTGCAAEEDVNEPQSIFETKVGDCFTPDEGNTAAFVVPCAEAHLYEVAAVHPVEEANYPGDDAMQSLVDGTCPEAFLAYTGEAPAASTEWASMAFAPTEPGWNEQGDRAIICVVMSLYGEPETGSANRVTSQESTPEGTP